MQGPGDHVPETWTPRSPTLRSRGHYDFDVFLPDRRRHGPRAEAGVRGAGAGSLNPTLQSRSVRAPPSGKQRRPVLSRQVAEPACPTRVLTLGPASGLASGPCPRGPGHDSRAIGNALAGQVQGPGRDPGRRARVDQPRADEEGIFDLNTTGPTGQRGREVPGGAGPPDQVHIDDNDYTLIPRGQIRSIRPGQATSPRHLTICRKMTSTSSATRSSPTPRPVANDTIRCSRRADPCAGPSLPRLHLDFNNVMTNISFISYMQPINGVTRSTWSKISFLPASLMSSRAPVVLQARGPVPFRLPVAVNASLQQAWLQARSLGRPQKAKTRRREPPLLLLGEHFTPRAPPSRTS